MLGLFLLIKCSTKRDSNNVTQTSSLPFKTSLPNSLAGEWKYNNTIWYTSELTLRDNGTFKFHNQGCYGQTFTEGYWTDNMGAILLSSYDSYRPTEETKALTQSLNERPSKKAKLKKGEYSFADFKEATLLKILGPNDTIRVYFDKVQLNLKGDTLYCVDNNKFIAEHKFSRTKNNR
jgi:hypothetical protein